MNNFKIITVALFFTLISWQAVYGQVKSWDQDKAHSNIYFSVDHVFAKVHGHFNDFKVKVNFDPANLAESSFFFEIKVESIDTNITKRDKQLKSRDFFDASEHPLITFQSGKITEVDNGRYNVSGKLNIKGKEYDFVLPLSFAGIKDHPAVKGKEVVGFNGKITLDRLEYNVGGGKFYKIGVVGKDVDVLVSLELLSGK